MTAEQFTYWLQGYSEITGENPTKEQWNIIKDHLQLVFTKVTPVYTPFTPTPSILPQWYDNTLPTTLC